MPFYSGLRYGFTLRKIPGHDEIMMEKKHLLQRLEGSRIELRKHEEALAKQMFAYVDKDRERLRRFLPWVAFVSSEAAELGWIQKTHQLWNESHTFDYGIFRKTDNLYMGNIGVHTILWEHSCCEIGYWILGDFEGHGYMSEALRVLEKHLFEVGFNRVEVHCSSANSRSAQVAQACAYTFEGILKKHRLENGEYRDTSLFSKLAEHYQADLIRSTSPLDKTNIIRIAKQLPEHFTLKGLKTLESDFGHQKGLLFFTQDKATGFLLYHSHQGEIELTWMGVLPAFQNRKIGKRLVEYLEILAIESNIKTLRVSTLDESVDYSPYEKTREFYLKMGFQKERVIEHADNPEWEAELILKKSLSP